MFVIQLLDKAFMIFSCTLQILITIHPLICKILLFCPNYVTFKKAFALHRSWTPLTRPSSPTAMEMVPECPLNHFGKEGVFDTVRRTNLSVHLLIAYVDTTEITTLNLLNQSPITPGLCKMCFSTSHVSVEGHSLQSDLMLYCCMVLCWIDASTRASSISFLAIE